MTSFSRTLSQSWQVKFHYVKLLKFKTFNFDLKFYWNWSFFHYEKIMRFKIRPQLPGAGRTKARHHHGSHTPTSPEAILLGKMAHHTKQIRWECMPKVPCCTSVILDSLLTFACLTNLFGLAIIWQTIVLHVTWF